MYRQANTAVRMKELLNSVFTQMREQKVENGIEALFEGLHRIRCETELHEWTTVVHSTALKHPLRELVHLDPITRRSFEKPRGYAGDAILMDMIYGLYDGSKENGSAIGHTIYEYNRQSDASSAVRTRRAMIARLIDETCEQRQNPRILSLACGHLREAELSEALQSKQVSKFLALDQDRKSLEVVRNSYSDLGIKALNVSVRDMLGGAMKLETCDLIYSAGLYDYLETKAARKLTCVLFDMLAPGGILLLTNFLPQIRSVGYMEAFMAWKLIYRTEAEIVDLISRIPRREVEKAQVFVERHENIGFVKVYKRF